MCVCVCARARVLCVRVRVCVCVCVCVIMTGQRLTGGKKSQCLQSHPKAERDIEGWT